MNVDEFSLLTLSNIVTNFIQFLINKKKTRSDIQLSELTSIQTTMQNLDKALKLANEQWEKTQSEFDEYKLKNDDDKRKMKAAFTRALTIACDVKCKKKHLSNKTVEKIVGDAEIISD